MNNYTTFPPKTFFLNKMSFNKFKKLFSTSIREVQYLSD